MILKLLTSGGVVVSLLQGMESPQYKENYSFKIICQEPKPPQDILLLEIWDKIFHQLELDDRVRLAQVCTTFRADFFWLPACRLYLPEAVPPMSEIKSLISYVLLTYKIRSQFYNPMILPVIPFKVEEMISLTFKKPRSTTLHSYIEKVNKANEVIKMMNEDIYYQSQYCTGYRHLYYEIFAEAGDQRCCQELYEAAARGTLDFSLETGYAYLKERSSLGDQVAQQQLNLLAATNSLSGKEGKAYLEKRSAQGDQDARRHLNYREKWRQNFFLDATDLACLEARVLQGDQDAQEHLKEIIVYEYRSFISKTERRDGEIRNSKSPHAQIDIGRCAAVESDKLTALEVLAYLEHLITQGDESAQKALNWAAHTGKLSFNHESGRLYLEKRMEEGDKDAEAHLYDAAIAGELLFNLETGHAYLEKRAIQGSITAQQRLNDLAFTACAFQSSGQKRNFFTPQTGEHYLKERSEKGDNHARSWFYSLGSNSGSFCFEEKFIHFFEKAKIGDIVAYQFFLASLLVEKPAQAIIFRWHFILYYTLMGFSDNPFNYEG